MPTQEQFLAAARNAASQGDMEAAQRLQDAADALRMQAGDTRGPRAEYAPTPPTPPREDKFGDTIRTAVTQPAEATMGFVRGLADPTQSPTNAKLPDWLQGPSRGGAMLLGDAGGAVVSGLGTGIAFGSGLAGELFGGSPQNEVKLAGDLMSMAQVAVPELSGVSSTTRLAASGARKATSAATDVNLGARAADDLGITPSLGAGGKVRAMTAAGLEKVPVTGGIIGRDAVRFLDEINEAANAATANIGAPRTPNVAGSILQEGLGGFVDKFKTKSNELYLDVGRFIPGKTNIDATNTVNAIREMVDVFSQNPKIAARLNLGKWEEMADDLENGIPWEAASALRTSIGEGIGSQTSSLAGMGEGRLKLIYGTLTEDLAAAAQRAGKPAQDAWKRANDYYRGGATRIQDKLDKTITAQSPERAFEAFSNMAKKDRASSDVSRMLAIKKSLKPDDWSTISASIIDRLGTAKPGAQNAEGTAFSASTFLTNWNGMSQEAKNILLTPAAREELNNLARVAGLAKSANAERNVSNTGTVVGLLATGSALTTNPKTTLAIIGASAISSKAMTSAPFLRALNNWAARGDKSSLRSIAVGKTTFAEDAQTVLRLIAAETAANQGNPARGANQEMIGPR